MKARRPIAIPTTQGMFRKHCWWWLLSIVALGAVPLAFRWGGGRESSILAHGSEPSGSAGEQQSPELRNANGISVVVEGRELVPGEEEALRSLAEHLLSDAVTAALNDAVEEIARDLSLSDEIEKQLILEEIRGGEDSVYSVYLTRPGDSTRLPEAAEWRVDGHVAIRFVRLCAPVERPTAIVVENSIVDGRPLSSDRLLTYDAVWREVEPAGHTK